MPGQAGPRGGLVLDRGRLLATQTRRAPHTRPGREADLDEAYERVLASGVCYRFVIDTAATPRNTS
ncbi:hypothetical protein [Streptomyces ipomoeae]|uniref:hypothetical protein n=1 Tax=Streptomyces ipomoeae TaxID=103232 RepID=UPI0015F0839F|nr:hypothetical protein [Streptomyces ipomoeae]MDX2931666.1 hypothetical protein [Streptomyces ipomoeae]